MKEKTRPKEKEKTTEESIESETVNEDIISESESEKLEVLHTPKATVETSTIDTADMKIETETEVLNEASEYVALDETEVLLPSWGTPDESEWMYGIPPREEDRMMWAGEWADFLLQWAEHHSMHILSVAAFISEPPFKYLRNKVDSFKMIAQVLIDKEIAEWLDRRKRQLRIYWRPLEDWADSIYAWALRTGKLRLDVKSIVIQESTEDFASLPEKDLYNILAILVEKELAEWVDKKKGAIIVST